MSSLQKPKNDWAKSLWIMNESFMGGVSMAKVLTQFEPCFYKFSTRLNEVIKEHPKLVISKVRMKYKSRLDGKQRTYIQYTPICPKPYLINLYNKINNEGFKGKTNSPNEN